MTACQTKQFLWNAIISLTTNIASHYIQCAVCQVTIMSGDYSKSSMWQVWRTLCRLSVFAKDKTACNVSYASFSFFINFFLFQLIILFNYQTIHDLPLSSYGEMHTALGQFYTVFESFIIVRTINMFWPTWTLVHRSCKVYTHTKTRGENGYCRILVHNLENTVNNTPLRKSH